MDLRSAIDRVCDRRKSLVLYNVDRSEALLTEVAETFQTQNVDVGTADTASGTPRVGVLDDNERVLDVVELSTLRELVESVPTGPGGLGIADADYESLLRHLKETTFTSYDRATLLDVSREIEDRAFRVGTGRLHAGFQRCSIMAEEADRYTALARRGLDVHVYGVPDVDVPSVGDAQIHDVETDEIARSWFVVFAADVPGQESALVAQEHPEGEFFGFWTYDAKIVAAVDTYLQRAYGSTERRHRRSQP